MKAAMMKRTHFPSSGSSSSSSSLPFSPSTVLPRNPNSTRKRLSVHQREADLMKMKKKTTTEMGPPTASTPPLPSSRSISSSSSPASVHPRNPNPKKRSWDKRREEANPMKKKKKTTTEMGPPTTAPPVPLSPSSLRAAQMRIRFAGLIGKCSGKSKEEIERQKKKDEVALAEGKMLEAERQAEMLHGQRARERLMRERMEAEAAIHYTPLCCSLKEIGVVKRCVEAQAWAGYCGVDDDLEDGEIV